MKRYSNYKTDKNSEHLSIDDIKNVKWTNYKIIVPTEEDRQELMGAFKHFHDEGFDSDLITVNQLAHTYHDETGITIIVDRGLYNSINGK